jgi:peptide/nickel transport system permease protein
VLKYIVKRLLALIPVLFVVSLVIFLLIHLVPGDPAAAILGENATQDQIDALRVTMGLDQPLPMQYLQWMAKIFHGDLGTSFFMKGTMVEILRAHMIPTLQQTAVAVSFATLVGVPLGMIAAIHRGQLSDRLISGFSTIGVSMPSFLMGLGLVLLFSVKLGWLPASGMGGIQYYILPAIANSLGGVAGIARQTRSSILEVIRSDYVTTARSKGLTEREVVYKHILPNALIPIITVAGGSFAAVFGGSVIIETVFSIDGIGLYMMSGITSRDYPVVQGCVVLLGIIFSLCMLLVDIAYAYVDPRIKAQYEGESKKKVKGVAKA